jgi:hypothetical protein
MSACRKPHFGAKASTILEFLFHFEIALDLLTLLANNPKSALSLEQKLCVIPNTSW